MSKVVCTVGVSGSGKSTWSREFVAKNAGWVVVERDQLRIMQGFPPVGSRDQENIVTKIQRGLIETALLDGYSVIISDTNLNKDIRQGLVKYVHKLGYDVEFRVFDVPLETCIARDAARQKPVGEVVIRRQYNKFKGLKDNGFAGLDDAPVEKFTSYLHADNKPYVVCVDLDGSTAEGGRRSPYDYSNVIADKPILDVINIVKALANSYDVVVTTGRTDDCREQTEAWVKQHIGDFVKAVYMRKAGDERADYIIKSEIYDRDILPHYNVLTAVEDRSQVVTHLRNRGITVCQVAPGRF